MEARTSFWIWFIVANVLGLTSIALLSNFLQDYNGGFAWSDKPLKEFNWHPILMFTGLVFLNANGKFS